MTYEQAMVLEGKDNYVSDQRSQKTEQLLNGRVTENYWVEMWSESKGQYCKESKKWNESEKREMKADYGNEWTES